MSFAPFTIIDYAATVFATECFQIIPTSVLYYDYVITIDREVNYFWTKNFTHINALFFINRYLGLFGASIFLYCTVVAWTRNSSNLLTIVAVDYILVLRVTALWGNNKIISVVLSALLVLEAFAKILLFIKNQKLLEYDAVSPLHGITVCVEDSYKQALPQIQMMLYADWTIPTVFGFILMVLAIYKAFYYWKESAGFKGYELLWVIFKDQVLYFFLVVICNILNIIHYKFSSVNYILSNILQDLVPPTILCVIGNRMLFNLKEAAELGLNQGTNHRVQTVSSIDFGDD